MLPSPLLVTNEYPPEKIAGTAMSTRFLAEELSSRGTRVTVVVNTRQTAPGREVAPHLDVFRLRPFRLPMTRMAQRVALLVNIARRIRPDVIQGQSISCGCLAVLAGRCLGIPAVTYIQGLDLYQSGPWAGRTYIRWTLKHSDRLVAVTPDLSARAYALSGRTGEVIPHGLRVHATAHELTRESARVLTGLPPEGRVVLFVGRLIPLKGVVHLIRAMGRVVAQCPDARLVLVGEGAERSHLTELSRKLALEQHILFVGQRPHEDVVRFMRAADVFVLPSLIESFGIVLVEAMSCGLPVVASNVMGIPAIVEDGRNGFLTSPGDEGALADRITRLLVDPAERGRVGRTNKLRALDYAMPRIVDRFLTLWDGALASRHGASHGYRASL